MGAWFLWRGLKAVKLKRGRDPDRSRVEDGGGGYGVDTAWAPGAVFAGTCSGELCESASKPCGEVAVVALIGVGYSEPLVGVEVVTKLGAKNMLRIEDSAD